jgi:hypothetical protein
MRPLFQAITVYLVSFILPPIVYAVFSSTVGFEYLRSHAYIFGTLLEFFFVGFLCILFAILNHDPERTYGLTRKGLIKSLTIGLVIVGVQSLIYYVSGLPVIDPKLDAFTQSLAQPFPNNIGFAFLCGFAYGPLQVFFIIFLVDRFNKAIDAKSLKIGYKGTIITVLLWALPHILNVTILGPTGALIQLVKLLVQGTILIFLFKYTGNSIGSMIYWTFIELAQTY